MIGTDTFAPDVNGAARFTERLAAGLVARGHDVHVVAPAASRRHGTWTEPHEGERMTVHRLYSWRWYPHDWLRFALPWTINRNSARILDELAPDVVHSQSFFVIGRGLSVQAQKRGIRVVATNHVMPENMLEFTLIPKWLQDKATAWSWRLAQRALARAESVTTPTRRAADFLERYTNIRDVHAISCGIDSSRYTPDFEPRTGNKILFVGRVTGEKQIDVLIRAVAQLDADLPATLTIIGGGDQLKELQKLVASLGLEDRVHFAGYVSDEELIRAYTEATVFAMPSIAELQSIATMEAMSSGLPVVAADAMALPHLVHDGENGYLFEPGNVEDLTGKLNTVLTAAPEELDRMKNASLDLIVAHDIQRTLATFEALYRGETVADPVTETPAIE